MRSYPASKGQLLYMNDLTKRNQWHALIAHHQELADQHMRDWFMRDNTRFSRFSTQNGEIFLDYSRNRINEKTIGLLCDLAQATQLKQKINALFSGHAVNITEKRPALHMALRDKNHTPIEVNGENIATIIIDAQHKIHDFVKQIHAGKWKGVTGKPIKYIVNIGIGGSHLGPMMCTHALKDFAISNLQFHFISTVDKSHLNDVLEQVDPETTLFIVSSKSFNTIETLTNAKTILSWMENKLGHDVLKHHFIAITAAAKKAIAFGIPEANIFPLWDWIGGRYSIWSAIGMPLILMLGNEQFNEFLTGAYEMDQHFQQTEFAENLPVILGLLGIWYMNFFGASVQALIPYSHRLRYLIPFIQQAEMESNGKSISLLGQHIPYTTSPVIFGEEGCNGQHTYHQLLHQGRHLIPADFILIGKVSNQAQDHHQDILIASALSQAQALMRGKTSAEIQNELLAANYLPEEATFLAQHKATDGNRPSNVIFIERMSPRNLGALIALYEHKIFVQGAIWDINSFDQWGVELGKQLLPDILNSIQSTHQNDKLDSATAGLINKYLSVK